MEKKPTPEEPIIVETVDENGNLVIRQYPSPVVRIATQALLDYLHRQHVDVRFIVNDEEVNEFYAEGIINKYFKEVVPTLDVLLLSHIEDEPMEIDLTPWAD